MKNTPLLAAHFGGIHSGNGIFILLAIAAVVAVIVMLAGDRNKN